MTTWNNHLFCVNQDKENMTNRTRERNRVLMQSLITAFDSAGAPLLRPNHSNWAPAKSISSPVLSPETRNPCQPVRPRCDLSISGQSEMIEREQRVAGKSRTSKKGNIFTWRGQMRFYRIEVRVFFSILLNRWSGVYKIRRIREFSPAKLLKLRCKMVVFYAFWFKLFTFSKVLFSLESIRKMTYLILNLYNEIISVGIFRKY